jgi:hypothetical protein
MVLADIGKTSDRKSWVFKAWIKDIAFRTETKGVMI